MPLTPTWTDPTERTSGELINANHWNTDLGNNLLFLKERDTTLTNNVTALQTDVAALQAGIAARFTRTSVQTIANNTETIVNFNNSTIHAPTGMVTTGAAWKFTAPIDGNYFVAAAVMFNNTTGWSDGEIGRLVLYKNNTLYAYLARKDNYGSASSLFMQLEGSSLVNLAANDTIDIRVFQSSGGDLDITSISGYNHVNIFRV